MYKLLLTIPLIAALGACDTTDQSMAAGALGGALIGAAVSSSDDRTKGAIIGGVAGAVAGNLIGKAPTAGDCVYQNPDGSRYVARCPA
ncbi:MULTISPECIES: YMGG-like glycine zipper-containing protein [Lentibacter]|jgi:outer membrane lipoprotein SlyB|uniref:Glycine zipper 2TM domain-containing protein n=1 Tax=Lentibacter algarum TaxID=576131 RepID=A0A1H3GZ68_9RHOB|nr:YMGG-like glycine zipper-containing protein [Lentibacter algarum]MCO4777458.1 glycine zipper 2TM domain-containing protein [Lentibacter algarum]MCO4828709.1 glycine zipper 2TM domain-containing protein [Lentibacter algarum]WIF30599.1 Glycine zipper 2TM domain protein [Lentibacter algarum]SDY08582.1 Glycine zipper 2TM domain-containing protein [Lentibacter algarum]